MSLSMKNDSSNETSHHKKRGFFERIFSPNELNNQQLRYLSQASVLEEASLPYRFKVIMITVTCVAILAIVWASAAKIKEVAKTTGDIIPSTPVQVIQHLDGGTVAEILASDSMHVEEGQVLMRLSGAGIRAELQRAQTKDLALRTQAERYSAFANFSAADFEQFKSGQSNLAAEQKKILESMIENRDKQKNVILEQLRQKKENLKMTESKIQTLKKNIVLTRESFKTKQKLFKRGYMQKTILIEIEKEVNSLVGELEKAKSELSQDKQSIMEFNNRLKSLESNLRDEALQKLSTLKADIAENAEIIKKLTDQVERLEIKSPVAGIVKGEEITTIGGVVAPGQKIMEIVPNEGELIAEVRINPSDIGNIKVNQPCLVKISTFDYSRYGGINGRLISVSATTFISKEGVPYYKGRIKLEKNYLGSNPKINLISPGNVVSADIIIGDKSVMEYLLKPLKIALHSAFSEH